MDEKKVTLICGSRDTGDSLSEQLVQYLQDDFPLELVVLDESYPESLESYLIIFSSHSLEIEAREKIGNLRASRFISGRRTISHNSIDSLVSIPPGSQVLFINDDRLSAEECIEALKQTGFNQFQYIPAFPPKIEADGISIAITAGETHLVPPEVKRVYDLGSRIFDFPTLSSILLFLNIPLEKIEAPSFRYLRKIVATSSKVFSYSRRINELNNQLLLMIEGSGEGLLTYDTGGTILAANERFRALVGDSSKAVGGINLEKLDLFPPLLRFLTNSRKEEQKRFETVRGDFTARKSFHRNSGTYLCSIVFHGKGMPAAGPETPRFTFTAMKSQSPLFRKVLRQAEILAGTELNILLTGEKGTGRSALAQAIHNASSGRDKSFIFFNPAVLGDEEIPGKFDEALDRAYGGTLYIREAIMLPERERIKLHQKLKYFRIIASSSGSLTDSLAGAPFSHETGMKLSEAVLAVPPLRERKEDISILLGEFTENRISPPLEAYLKSCSWLGNISELANVARSMTALAGKSTLAMEHLPEGMIGKPGRSGPDLTERDLSILRTVFLLNRRGTVAGREGISRELGKEGIFLSEGQVRNALKRFEKKGYLAREENRYGVFLTESGKEMIGNSEVIGSPE